ncbi:MAG: polysaccharide biosynthesis/export family protein [Planctomycetota bacterium]|nr:polysaccharide biosynthesis/export family protein [Planctomycetota bacterium]
MKIKNQILKFALMLAATSFCSRMGDCFIGSAQAQLMNARIASAPSPYGYESGATQACGCGAVAGCRTCGGCGRIPAAVQMCPPQQPTGVTSGACKPCISGIDCAQDPYGEKRWRDARPIDFEPLWHGEYIGPVRLPSLLEYRVRINDEVTFTYIPNRQKTIEEYKLMVGDEISLDSISDSSIRQAKVPVQPDGTIIVPLLKAPVAASGKTIQALRKDLELAYKQYIVSPAIDILPVKVNTAVEDLKDAVNGPFAAGGRALASVVNPDGKVQLIGIGSVFILGMTIDEIKREVNLRYRETYVGIDVEPRLTRTASHVCFVFGEVVKPGRFEMDRPTSVTQIIAQAEGPKNGANMRQVVILRRAEDWRLVSTMLDLQGAHLGKRPNPSDEIWLRDGDTVLIVKRPIKRVDDAIQLLFTDGLYRVVPFQGLSIQRQ